MFLNLVLNLLPLFFLVLASLVILAIQRWQPSIGISWVVGFLGVLFSWACVLIFHWVSVPMVTIDGWLDVSGLTFDLVFGFDAVSWHFTFCVLTILLAVMLTAPIRLTVVHDPREWVLDLGLTTVAILPILAQTPLSLILSWTFLDIIEIVLHLRVSGETILNRQAIMAFAARLSGTSILYWAFLSSQFSGDHAMNFTNIEAGTGLLFLLAVGLRLGVFPVLVPFSREIPLRRELGTILRFVVPASSLALLTRLDALVMPAAWAVILSIFALTASIFGVIRFFFASSELTGRPFWMIALAGMAVASVVRGEGEAALIWSTVLLLIGSYLSLHSYRTADQWWLMIPGLLGLSGLPFSPAAAGWAGLLVLPFNMMDILFLLVFVLLLLGFIKHAFRQEESDNAVELWMRIVYPIGLFVIILVQWFLSIDRLTVSLSTGTWWAAVLSIILALMISFIMFRWLPGVINFDVNSNTLTSVMMKTDIVFRFLQSIYLSIQNLTAAISTILEGEGAILWATLLMILILTLLRTGVPV